MDEHCAFRSFLRLPRSLMFVNGPIFFSLFLRVMTFSLVIVVPRCQTHLLAQTNPTPLGENNLDVLTVHNEAWQNSYACGPNCLFVFLRLHGQEVSHKDLLADMPVTDRGVSLQSLKEQAERYSVPVMVARAGPKELDKLPLPVIVHQGQGQNDHFVVLCEVGKDKVTIIDGGNGNIEQITRSQFEQMWSGYLLVTAPRWGLPDLPILTLFALGLYFVLLHRTRRENINGQGGLEKCIRTKATDS